MIKAALRRIFVHNFYLKFVAAVLTLALYIWVSDDREMVVAGYAPVRVVVPDDMVLTSDPLDRVKVTIRGRWSDINRFDPSQIDPIRIDLTRTDQDSVVALSTDMVRVPPGLRVVAIEPGHMLVQLEEEADKSVRVVAQIVGEPRPPYALSELKVTPEEVVLRGPRSVVDRISTVSTEALDLSNRTQSFQKQVRLRLENPQLSYDLDQPIVVQAIIVTQEATRTFENVPVSAVNTTHAVEVSPPTTTITVRGPSDVVERMRTDIMRAELDLSAEDRRPPGTFSKDVIVRNLPSDVTLVRVYPMSFRVTTTPR
ncbi:MAG: YbbR-like domain-containing protein [Bradymonadaceae bacterium]|nr:YbbR-like domain-containing protein [Lujinxingiaceae bacterium]